MIRQHVQVTVDVDLLEIDADDLARALVEIEGKEDALRLVSECKTKADRRSTHYDYQRDRERERERMRDEVRHALALIDRGRREEGMHMLRMFCAPTVDLSQWESVKSGKHPFLSLSATPSTARG
jgi:hypothetical protein